MARTMTQKAVGRLLTREEDVHAEDAGHEGQRQDDDAEGGQDPQDVVDVVREDRLVRGLQALDDLLVVLQRVPDPLRGVDDVVEVDVQLLGRGDVHGSLEVAEGHALGPHDAPEVDDLLLERWRCRARPPRSGPRRCRPRCARASGPSCAAWGTRRPRRGRRSCRAGRRRPSRSSPRGPPRSPGSARRGESMGSRSALGSVMT